MKRRDFLKCTAAAAGFSIVPSSVFAQFGPNSKINVAHIGCGRICREHDLPEVIRHDFCRYVAVADVDLKRAKDGKKKIDDYYAKKNTSTDVKVYQDYREMLQDKSIDAVVISTPDHWHAQPAMEAALAGKDVYLQKPTSLTIAEGRQMSDTFNHTGRIFQLGSQQRSRSPWPQFKLVCELVRNGRLGELKHVEVGLGTDPGCGDEPEMPIPSNLNYDMWLGATPEVYYTEKRVHPQKDFSRPGWLRCEQFGAGMITGWGVHHLDIAHWGMGAEFTGPTEIECEKVVYPKSGLWNVHGDFTIHAKYASGVTMEISSRFTNGVKFIGTEGWIFVSRGNVQVTASDPVPKGESNALKASDPKMLAALGPDGFRLYDSPEQHLNWLECIRNRQMTISPAEVAHRSCTVCLVSHISMKFPKKKLYWNPVKEEFVGNAEANSMLSRPQRKPWGTNNIKV